MREMSVINSTRTSVINQMFMFRNRCGPAVPQLSLTN